MIVQLQLENFTTFKHIEIDFSPKINVIIGENGTGKTHLLKAAYALSMANAKSEMSARKFATFLVQLFGPLGNRMNRLCHSELQASMAAKFDFGLSAKASFGSTQSSVELHKASSDSTASPLLIPAKEVMSTLSQISQEDLGAEWFSRLFDIGYIDLCAVMLSNDDSVDYRSDPRLGTMIPKITAKIGGRYEFTQKGISFRRGQYVESKQLPSNSQQAKMYSDSTKMEFKSNSTESISNGMTAEGFRKVGTIQRLLVNGYLIGSIDAPLFWDEPEANMNPKLMQLLVETLLELSRNGKQIILATHDYFLLKWFDLLMEDEKEDHVRFHSLYREESGDIAISSTDDYLTIEPNPIDETFEALINSDLDRTMGDLGR